MQLLISISDAAEARAAIDGGADIIDIKNPVEGALGAAPVHALREVGGLMPPGKLLSAALGESSEQAGQIALAAYGAAALGARYVKLALHTADPDRAVALLRTVHAAADLADPACRLIAVAYADAERIGALPWSMLPEIAQVAGIAGCMIDTAIKDGYGLFDYCAADDLAAWLAACRAAGLLGALAGTLRAGDLPMLRRLQPDIVGFRSAACRGDRVTGRVDAALVAALRSGLIT